MRFRNTVGACAAATLVIGISAMPAFAEDAELVEKEIYTSADTTLQAWANEKTQSNAAKPYIGTLHPTPGALW